MARTEEAAFAKLEAQPGEDLTGAGALFGFGSFLFLFMNPISWNASGFLGPGQVWSGPNRCFKQWSMVQSRHLIVFENVRVSLQPWTGHFFFLVAFS